MPDLATISFFSVPRFDEFSSRLVTPAAPLCPWPRSSGPLQWRARSDTAWTLGQSPRQPKQLEVSKDMGLPPNHPSHGWPWLGIESHGDWWSPMLGNLRNMAVTRWNRTWMKESYRTWARLFTSWWEYLRRNAEITLQKTSTRWCPSSCAKLVDLNPKKYFDMSAIDPIAISPLAKKSTSSLPEGNLPGKGYPDFLTMKASRLQKNEHLCEGFWNCLILLGISRCATHKTHQNVNCIKFSQQPVSVASHPRPVTAHRAQVESARLWIKTSCRNGFWRQSRYFKT
jgi:hypothetical protein